MISVIRFTFLIAFKYFSTIMNLNEYAYESNIFRMVYRCSEYERIRGVKFQTFISAYE